VPLLELKKDRNPRPHFPHKVSLGLSPLGLPFTADVLTTAGFLAAVAGGSIVLTDMTRGAPVCLVVFVLALLGTIGVDLLGAFAPVLVAVVGVARVRVFFGVAVVELVVLTVLVMMLAAAGILVFGASSFAILCCAATRSVLF